MFARILNYYIPEDIIAKDNREVLWDFMNQCELQVVKMKAYITMLDLGRSMPIIHKK